MVTRPVHVTDHNPSAPPFQLPAPPLTPWLSVSPQASRREADEAAAKEAKASAAAKEWKEEASRVRTAVNDTNKEVRGVSGRRERRHAPHAARGRARLPCRHFEIQSGGCLELCFRGFRVPARVESSRESPHPAGHERIESSTQQTLEDPIVGLSFEVAALQAPMRRKGPPYVWVLAWA